MASPLESTTNLHAYVPPLEANNIRYNQIYKEHCDRIYSLSFWMTDNELAAEELSTNTFLRAFSVTEQPVEDEIDRAFLAEARQIVSIGALTLNSRLSSPKTSIQTNMKRVHLERAVVQLPATEKLIFLLHDVENYGHERVSRLLGISEHESKSGLHHARLQIRNLISAM
jgi:DNA-directed RNA polymerase specialized sigma24 family protein